MSSLQRVVVDNSVFSLLYRDQASVLQFRYLSLLDRSEEAFLPFQAFAEALAGVKIGGWGERKFRLFEQTLSSFEVIYPTRETVEIFADLLCHSQMRGRSLHSGDAWIAAVAVSLGVPLLHHDADFEGLGFPGLETVTLLGGA